jgi:hypothetical protein
MAAVYEGKPRGRNRPMIVVTELEAHLSPSLATDKREVVSF